MAQISARSHSEMRKKQTRQGIFKIRLPYRIACIYQTTQCDGKPRPDGIPAIEIRYCCDGSHHDLFAMLVPAARKNAEA